MGTLGYRPKPRQENEFPAPSVLLRNKMNEKSLYNVYLFSFIAFPPVILLRSFLALYTEDKRIFFLPVRL